MAQALEGKTIDVGELCSTQPDIIVNDWVVLLQDDKQTQPADNIAPLVRNDYLAKDRQGGVREAPQRRVGQDGHRDAGRPRTSRSSVDKKDIAAVAKAWLKAKGLVK